MTAVYSDLEGQVVLVGIPADAPLFLFKCNPYVTQNGMWNDAPYIQTFWSIASHD